MKVETLKVTSVKLMEVFNHYNDLINLRLGEFKTQIQRFDLISLRTELKEQYKVAEGKPPIVKFSFVGMTSMV